MSWAIETIHIINRLSVGRLAKAFDPDWFLLRQRLEQIEAKLTEQGIEWDGEKFAFNPKAGL